MTLPREEGDDQKEAVIMISSLLVLLHWLRSAFPSVIVPNDTDGTESEFKHRDTLGIICDTLDPPL